MSDVFSAEVEQDENEVVIRVFGEVDLTTCDDLRQVIEAELGAENLVVIDLAQLDFMDSSALVVLVATRQQQIDKGGRFVVRNPSSIVLRLLGATGLSFVLNPDPD